MSKKEEWKNIPGYNGEYQCSTEGRIKSFRTRSKTKNKSDEKGHILSTPCNGMGYPNVNLHGTLKQEKGKAVSAIVAKTFLNSKYDSTKHQINRKRKEEKTNVSLGNLVSVSLRKKFINA